jgi:hypothetical protein
VFAALTRVGHLRDRLRIHQPQIVHPGTAEPLLRGAYRRMHVSRRTLTRPAFEHVPTHQECENLVLVAFATGVLVIPKDHVNREEIIRCFFKE